MAESTTTGIIGREAVYSGKAAEWEAAMQSTTRLGPEKYEFGPYPMPKVAMPGVYQFTQVPPRRSVRAPTASTRHCNRL